MSPLFRVVPVEMLMRLRNQVPKVLELLQLSFFVDSSRPTVAEPCAHLATALVWTPEVRKPSPSLPVLTPSQIPRAPELGTK